MIAEQIKKAQACLSEAQDSADHGQPLATIDKVKEAVSIVLDVLKEIQVRLAEQGI